jgi:hypothetical protein
MKLHTSLRRGCAALAVASGALVPALADAQATQPGMDSGHWKYGATIYLYSPTVGGSSSFPVDTAGNPINADASPIIDHLKMAFMGSFAAHNGRWGFFTDVLYLDLGGEQSQTRDFTIGDIGIPGGTTADIGWDLKGTIWTLAGQYRLAADPAGLTVDALAGARRFHLQQSLSWALTGSIGPIDPTSRIGATTVSDRVWDAIVGVKGRAEFGSNREWSVPFYLDVGAGQSQLTYQAAAGIAYGFKWGELSALWRYIGYEMKSGKVLQDISFNGPMVGATFRW